MIFLPPTLGFRRAFAPPSLLGKGDLFPVLKLPSAIHGFAVVSLVFCRRLFSSMPSACFSGTLPPFSGVPEGEIILSLFLVQSYDFFLTYASICRFFFKLFLIIFVSLVAYQRTNVPFAIFDGEVKTMERGNI